MSGLITNLSPSAHAISRCEVYAVLTEPCNPENLAALPGHSVMNSPRGGRTNTSLSSDTASTVPRESTIQEELMKLISTNVFDACKFLKISNASVDDISFMVFIPKLGLDGATHLAREFGWKCERVVNALNAYLTANCERATQLVP